MPETIIKHSLKTAITLLAFTLVGTFMLAYVFDITREPIEKSEAEARLALFRQILSDEKYYDDSDDEAHESDLLKNTIEIPSSDLLGNTAPTKAYIAKHHHKFDAVILEAVAHDGYSGDIKLLIAIRADGTVSGVRVLAHKETPGLGDYIDITHGNWIKLFDNESVEKTPSEQWQVKKDGGKFDYMAGATITPRAVVKAVFKALQFFEQNQHMLRKAAEHKAEHEDKDES